MTKYDNHNIFPVIKNYDKNVYEFLKAFNTAICLSDDILDHQIHTDYVVEVMGDMFTAFCYLERCKGLAEKIKPLINEIVESEKLNLDFIPKKNETQIELEILFKRSSLMKLYFECLCYVDKTFDTKENRAWIDKFCKAALIYNDAKGLIDGDFEDLIQCRRNYVLLTKFSPDIYYGWKDLVSDIKEKAQEVLNEHILEKPKDERLTMIGGSNA